MPSKIYSDEFKRDTVEQMILQRSDQFRYESRCRIDNRANKKRARVEQAWAGST